MKLDYEYAVRFPRLKPRSAYRTRKAWKQALHWYRRSVRADLRADAEVMTLLAGKMDELIEKQFRSVFGIQTVNAAPSVPAALTIESLKQTMRDFEVEQDARDLDLFLSDKWHFYRILRAGGSLVRIDDSFYAVDRNLIAPSSTPPRSPRT